MTYKPFQERTRFAWLPVRLWATPQPFTRQLNVWVWWCNVHEIQTILGHWIAYIEDQDIKGEA